jgi:hypothetical protein
MATNHCAKEALWLYNLLKCFGIPQNGPTTLFCDNLGTISLTKDTSFHPCSKHINVAHHFVCECVEMNKISFKHLPTHLMPMDTLTKLLGRPKLLLFCGIMGLQDKMRPLHQIEGECWNCSWRTYTQAHILMHTLDAWPWYRFPQLFKHGWGEQYLTLKLSQTYLLVFQCTSLTKYRSQ